MKTKCSARRYAKGVASATPKTKCNTRRYAKYVPGNGGGGGAWHSVLQNSFTFRGIPIAKGLT